ncbi:MAG: phosphoribosylanthranilate isomerase [Chitinophagaceae bacterium]|nr:phosphoribosylanthranilate isomerase [Chitinophagaceae bacterium]MCA6453259.1 phosphoribosylanthranilate isomerase [Chitinophagaceae bacterium]MCA6454494.1 phosphoribosylanthranilate isomerase [Chitinophagaceae bacterium]MCA6459233.1 phosphoribosylanthranilate isomerase [Chitinophagaceae bacterium]MCA6464603.1 phosphoribosylanthranilate isomerase [Chitinophagaceae bacterium]
MRIKVCGMTSTEQVLQLDEMGVEFAGFIFYPKSPRYVHKFMPQAEIKKIKGKHINKVGVFVNATVEEVLQAVDECGLYLVQLHGDETPKYCEKIANYVGVVKAFRLREEDNVLWKVKDYMDIADMFLFDTEGAGYGGTGKQFDWNILRGLNIGKPFFLSGGIGPNDVDKLKEFSGEPVSKDLFSADVNSKFEIAPGIKDMDMLRSFIQSVKQI